MFNSFCLHLPVSTKLSKGQFNMTFVLRWHYKSPPLSSSHPLSSWCPRFSGKSYSILSRNESKLIWNKWLASIASNNFVIYFIADTSPQDESKGKLMNINLLAGFCLALCHYSSVAS